MVMVDPVILTASGQTYERSAIQQWLYGGNRTDPLTRQNIHHTGLSTNHAVKGKIAEYHSLAPSAQPSTTPFTCQDVPAPASPSVTSTQPPADQVAIKTVSTTTAAVLRDQLELAAAHGNISSVQQALQQLPSSCLIDATSSALHAAAANGRSEVAALLLSSVACPSDARHSQDDSTPLHTAAINGWGEVAEVLIAHGADVHALDRVRCRSPLHAAAAMGHDDVLRVLLRHGAVLDAPDHDGATPLILAAKLGHATSVAILAAAGANPAVADQHGMTALHHACTAGDVAAARALLQHGSDPNMREHGGRTLTPLSMAISYGGAAVAGVLLDAGADIDVVDCEQCTALLRAIHANDLPLLQVLVELGADVGLLLQLGADVRLPNLGAVLPVVLGARRGVDSLLRGDPSTEWNPLVDAAWQQEGRMVELVLQRFGASVDAPALAGAVAAAIQTGNVAVLDALLAASTAAAVAEAGAVVEAVEDVKNIATVAALLQRGVLQQCVRACGPAPLHWHAAAGRADVMHALLSSGMADAHAQHGDEQRTALFHCSSAAAAEVLLAAGAAVDARDADGRTPLMVCTEPEVLQLLLAHGADLALADAGGQNALHIAARNGHSAKLRALLMRNPSTATALGTADSSGSLPLHAAVHAAASGVECLHVLLAADEGSASSVNCRDAAGKTPLLLAVEAGHHKAVRYLVGRGADISAMDACRRSPACAAALALNLRTLRFLLQRGAKVGVAVAADCLVKAIESEDEAIGMLLLEQLKEVEMDLGHVLGPACALRMPRLVTKMLARGADPAAVDALGRTALHAVCEAAAAGRADPTCVQLLLSAGALVHTPCNFGSTPLHLASKAGDLPLLEALLPHTPPPALWAPDASGATPLILSTMHGHPELTCAILSHLSRLQPSLTPPSLPTGPVGPTSIASLVNTAGPSGRTALHHTLLLHNPLLPPSTAQAAAAATLALLRAGADPSCRDVHGNSALHYAAACSPSSLPLLLPHASDVDAPNSSGATPLQLAAEANTPHGWAAVALLLAAGAAAEAPAAHAAAGQTLLHMAAAHPAACPVVQHLLQHGADPHAPDGQGRSAVEAAAATAGDQILRLLLQQGAAAPDQCGCTQQAGCGQRSSSL